MFSLAGGKQEKEGKPFVMGEDGTGRVQLLLRLGLRKKIKHFYCDLGNFWEICLDAFHGPALLLMILTKKTFVPPHILKYLFAH